MNHTPADELVDEDDFLIPAGGRRMEMDWERVTAAFQSAVERVGWDADLEIRPEKQYVMVRFSAGCPDLIADAMDEFYDSVEESIGSDAFMSIWIDFSFRSSAKEWFRNSISALSSRCSEVPHPSLLLP